MKIAAEPKSRKQHPPIYVVKSAGTCVEFTDDRKLAHAAYDMSNGLDKSMYRLDVTGRAQCVKRCIGGKELGNTPMDAEAEKT